jgi:hypothetical protein
MPRLSPGELTTMNLWLPGQSDNEVPDNDSGVSSLPE